MPYDGRSTRSAFRSGQGPGFWLAVSALLLVALLLPPLLLPLLLVLSIDPLLTALRLPRALAQVPASRPSSSPRALRGPPRI